MSVTPAREAVGAMSNPTSSLLPCVRSSSTGQAVVQSMDCDPGGVGDTPVTGHDPYQFWAVTPPEGAMDTVVVNQPVRQQHHHRRNAPTAEWGGAKGVGSTSDLPQEKPLPLAAARRHSHTATSATSSGHTHPPVPGYAVPQHEKIAPLLDHVSTTEGGVQNQQQRWPKESGESPLGVKPIFTFPSDSFSGAPSSSYSSPSSSSSAKGGYHHAVQTSCAGAVPTVATCILNRGNEGFGMVVSIDPGISNPDELPATGVSH